MVGQELHGHNAQKGFETVEDIGHFEEVVGKLTDVGVALGDHGQNASVAALHFLHIGDNLVVELMVRSDKDNGHLLVNQGYRTVLHLCGRISFSMDVADFLQFQCPFKCHGVVVAATQIKEVLGIGELRGQVGDGVVLE